MKFGVKTIIIKQFNMIRKQIYLNDYQNSILKYNTKISGISESMQIRIALDDFFKIKYEYDKNEVLIDTTPNFLKEFTKNNKIIKNDNKTRNTKNNR